MLQKICVIGLGYIGIPTSVLLADKGYRVFGCDIKVTTVEMLNKGQLPLVEPGLEPRLEKVVASGRFSAHLTPQQSDVYMLCVPTPSYGHSGNHAPNLSYIFSAATAIASLLKAGDTVILESTSPVGTTEAVSDFLRNLGVDVSVLDIAYCPERIFPGNALAELAENDRIVGGLTARATEAVCAFYRTFVTGSVLGTNARTAEMSKLVENSYRDVNIAFANELSILCHNQQINVWDLIALANRHPRVNILQPGPGVGGHCIAVDPWFLVAQDPENAVLIRRAREVNLSKTEWTLARIAQAVNAHVAAHGSVPVIGCFGLAFKADIDDIRESPSLAIARRLQSQGQVVMNVEPNISEVDGLTLVTAEHALNICDIRVILVKHRAFAGLEWSSGKKSAQTLDFCGAQRAPMKDAAVRLAA